jgi:hypothetical protein
MPYNPPPSIPYIGPNVMSLDMRYADRGGGSVNSGTDTAWVANLAVYAPFILPRPIVVMEWFINLGTLTTASNWDFGIYREDFTKIQTLGSTTAGTVASNFNNTTTWTDLTLPAGVYYMAYSNDSTRNHSIFIENSVVHTAAAGWMEQSTALPLPATATPVVTTRAWSVPFGFSSRWAI